jgi:predicted ATP-grasp superfamily ATP-dependent carboligase
MKPKVVIIGYGFTTRLGLIRSLSEITDQIDVIVIENDKQKPIDCYSQYVRHYYRTGNNEDVIIQVIKEKCTDKNQKVILIPTNDFSVTVIDKNIDVLKDDFLFSNIGLKQGAVIEWMNKEKQKETAKEIGLNVANAVNVEIKAGNYVFPTQIVYPCFTKTRSCITTGYKHTLRQCNNEIELRKSLDFIAAKFHNITIMVEDFKNISTEYAVVGFSNGLDVIIPGIIEILKMAKGVYKGIACQGKIIPIKGFDDLVEKFKLLIRKIGYVGLFDIDFYLSDSVFYFGEINLRIGGSGYAVSKMGVNLPAMFVKYLLGESVEEMENNIKKSASFVNERICSDDWYKGHLSTKEFLQMQKKSQISFVKDEKDKMPEKKFYSLVRKMWLKKIIKKLIRRV